MTTPGASRARDEVSASDRLSVALGALGLAAASGALTWLLWSHVPERLAFFAGLGVPLPLSTRLALAASNWFVRLLPLFVLALLPTTTTVGLLLYVLAARRGPRTAVRALTALLVGLALLELAAVALVLYGLHAGEPSA